MSEPQHQKYEVRDGDRIIEFVGDMLAESTSRRRGYPRWIEFQLYRTAAGSYVLSRIGMTVVFHKQSCALVEQYRLKKGDVPREFWPCDLCAPYHDDENLYPERVRYWAQVMTRPHGVVEALMKYDNEGTRYLTRVAERLLQEASEADPGILEAFKTEHVA